jgi:regulator of sigma D
VEREIENQTKKKWVELFRENILEENCKELVDYR